MTNVFGGTLDLAQSQSYTVTQGQKVKHDVMFYCNKHITPITSPRATLPHPSTEH